MTKTHENVNHQKVKKPINTWVVILIVLGILVVIASAFALFPRPTTENIKPTDFSTYNKFQFEKGAKYWKTQVSRNGQTYEAFFYNHPTALENMLYDNATTDYILKVPHRNFLIAVDPNEATSKSVLAGVNIARITGKFYQKETGSALYVPVANRTEAMMNTTIHQVIDCSESTQETPVIWINPNDNETMVYIHPEFEHCIVVGATNEEDIFKSSDLLTYKILRIMD